MIFVVSSNMHVSLLEQAKLKGPQFAFSRPQIRRKKELVSKQYVIECHRNSNIKRNSTIPSV